MSQSIHRIVRDTALAYSEAMGAAERSLHVTRHWLSVDDYFRMDEAGVFAPDARTELIEGEVLDMATIGTRHASTVKLLNRLLVAAAGTNGVVAVQDPLHLSKWSMPQPDLMLLAPRADFYAKAHPTPADVWLLIEVADSSVRFDLDVKQPLYARHGVAELWVIDLDAGVLLRHRKPAADAYALVEELTRPGLLTPDAAPSLVLDLSSLPLVTAPADTPRS